MKRNLIAFACAVIGMLVVLLAKHVYDDHKDHHIMRDILVKAQQAGAVPK